MHKKHKLYKMEDERQRAREDPTKTVSDKNNEPMVGRPGTLVVRIVFFVVCSQHGRDNVGDFQKGARDGQGSF